MNTKDIGNQAEDKAAGYLIADDYQIIDRNWKNRWCEIDIVAKKDGRVYFIEVKYRKNSQYGDGLDAITTKKLRQMQYAAQNWVNASHWDGDYELGVIAISPESTTYIGIY